MAKRFSWYEASQQAPAGEQKLLDCLLAVEGTAKRSRVSQFSEADWRQVSASATRHGLQPLLYECLSSAGAAAGIPEKVLLPLREAFLVNGLRNDVLYQDLQAVLAAFQTLGIPTILLKGVYLACWVYKTKASRPMADIDLMVQEKDLFKAASALLASGYSSGLSIRDLQEWRHAHPRAHHLPSFLKPQHPRIELHWALPGAIDARQVAACWQRAHRVPLGESTARALAPEDLLLYLCVHCRLHHFSQGLRPLYDIAEAIRHYRRHLDWSQVDSTAQAWQAERCVYLGLWLSQELLQAPVPGWVLKKLEPGGRDIQWAALTKAVVLTGEDMSEATQYTIRLAEICCAWRQNGRAGDKMQMTFRALFPRREQLAHHPVQECVSGPAFFRRPPARFIRLLDLLAKGLRAGWRGQLPDCGRRLHWHLWLEESASAPNK